MFGSLIKKGDVSLSSVPAEIVARVHVMGDTSDEPLVLGGDLGEKSPIPSVSSPFPHGPFQAVVPQPPEAIPEQVVSQVAADSSPFLKELPQAELLVEKKKSLSVEPPLFLTKESQQSTFGFGQTRSIGTKNTTVQEPIKKPIEFHEAATTSNLVLEEPSHSGGHVGWVIGGILMSILLALGGAYYYLYIRPERIVFNEPSAPSIPEIPGIVTTGGLSLVSPNYLPLNIETVTSADIRAQIRSTGDKVLQAGINTPVEFFVTDQNNTAIAFSRFVVLIDLKLPADIISLTDEKFSVYFVNDQGKSRIGFKIQLKSGSNNEGILKKAEGNFPLIFQGLFSETNISVPKKSLFKQSVYRDVPIRFNNVTGATNLSIDYALRENQWYIATSKDSMRAILDTIK